MERKTIFVGGIHGVGKTTLCEKLSGTLQIQNHSASSLIKKIKEDYSKTDDKRVVDIDDNQAALLTAIQQYIPNGSTYLLDGHFCLLGSDYAVNRIPPDIYRAIKPAGIIVFYDDIPKIVQRLLDRDERNYEAGILERLQCEELDYSKAISEELNIPYLSFQTGNDISIILNFLNAITDVE